MKKELSEFSLNYYNRLLVILICLKDFFWRNSSGEIPLFLHIPKLSTIHTIYHNKHLQHHPNSIQSIIHHWLTWQDLDSNPSNNNTSNIQTDSIGNYNSAQIQYKGHSQNSRAYSDNCGTVRVLLLKVCALQVCQN